MKGWQSTYSSLGMMVVPAPLLGLASMEQVRRGRDQGVGGPNRVKGWRSTYSSLGMMMVRSRLLGLTSREQVRRGRAGCRVAEAMVFNLSFSLDFCHYQVTVKKPKMSVLCL